MEQQQAAALYKRIILCADGTWLGSDQGTKDAPSNVARIARAISCKGLAEDGKTVSQIVYYRSGLGSSDLPLQSLVYGTLGLGLGVDVCEIYNFISQNYESGDEIFFFGFSRGAFTVRSVASLVSEVGVLSAAHMSHFPAMWKAYTANTTGESFQDSKWYKDHHDKLRLQGIKIKVVGVWDTVGALGIPEWPWVTWARYLGFPINQQFSFYDTKISKNIQFALQALAVDEKRFTYPPTLWHKTSDGPEEKLKQCWFPGVHGNIGGAKEAKGLGDHGEISDNTLAWMMDEVHGLLTFERESIDAIVANHSKAINSINIPNGWGCGQIVDNFYGVEGGLFWLLGQKDRTPGSYPRDPGDGASGATRETFHPLVRFRKLKLNYNPPPLHGFVLEEPGEDRVDGWRGWAWTKTGKQPVKEYVMRPDRRMAVTYWDNGLLRHGYDESLSRRLCPKNILMGLDRDNRIRIEKSLSNGHSSE